MFPPLHFWTYSWGPAAACIGLCRLEGWPRVACLTGRQSIKMRDAGGTVGPNLLPRPRVVPEVIQLRPLSATQAIKY